MLRPILPFLASILLQTACGGGGSPPVGPPPGTAAPAVELPPPVATSTAAPSAEPIVAAAPEAKPEPPPAASDDAAPPPASTELRGFMTGPLLGTEVVFVTVADASETCASVVAKGTPAKGAKRTNVRVQWLPGYYDLSNRMAEAKLTTYQGTFWLKEDATRGGVQVRVSPAKAGATGRIHVKASRPGSEQSLDAEVDVTMCADLEAKKRP